MNLYLSSFRLGNHPEALQQLAGYNKRVAIIGNAIDFKSDFDSTAGIQREIVDMTRLGFDAQELDLRKYFGNSNELNNKLDDFDLVWARGGNSFLLRQAMEKSGFDKALTARLQSDPDFTYSGYSAGVVVLSPTLEGIEIVDDADSHPTQYDAVTTWGGIGILDYSIAPHYQSDHPESAAIDKVVDYFESHNLPYKTLRDGEVILIRNGEETILH